MTFFRFLWSFSSSSQSFISFFPYHSAGIPLCVFVCLSLSNHSLVLNSPEIPLFFLSSSQFFISSFPYRSAGIPLCVFVYVPNHFFLSNSLDSIALFYLPLSLLSLLFLTSFCSHSFVCVRLSSSVLSFLPLIMFFRHSFVLFNL